MAVKSRKIIRVLIVSLPGMMQNVLRETFARQTNVDVVGVAGGCLSAVGIAQKTQPDLVVIDSNLPEEEINQLIVQLKKEHHPIRSLVLVESTQHLNKATNAGADITLLSYSLPGSLEPLFGNLIADQRTTD